MSGIESVWCNFLWIHVRPPETLLDVGCRDLRSTLSIAEWMGDRYCGVDVDKEAIARARARLPEATLEVVGKNDFGKCLGRKFDVVLASCVLYHLHDKTARRFFLSLPELLTGSGFAIATINTDQEESRWRGFPFVRRPVEFYEELANQAGMVVIDHGPISEYGYRLDRPTATNRLIQVKFQ